MKIHAFNRSHWVLIGIAAGLVLGTGRLLAVLNEPVGGPGFLSRVEFERDLRLPPVMGKPRLRSLTIHRRGSIDLVTFERLDVQTLRYRWCLFAAPRPYFPGEGEQLAAGYTIEDHLAQVAANSPGMVVRRAWWNDPAKLMLLCSAAGALVVGGLWPSVLRRVARSDSRTTPPDVVGIPSYSQGALGPDDATRLRDLELELIAAIDCPPPDELPSAPAPKPIRPPRVFDAEVAGPAPVDVHKEYTGEFYPVEKRGVPVREGFSLIELLVVIAMVSVLLSLLVPTIQTTRLQAQSVRCMSQLGQIGKALHCYAADNRGCLPACSGWHTWPPGGSDDSTGPAWTIEMIPYLGSPDSVIYNCPSFPGTLKYRNYFLAAQWAGQSRHGSMKLSDVMMTGRFVLAGDKTQRGLYPQPFGTSEHSSDDADPDDFGGGAPVLAWPWDPGGFYMHRGGNNVLFDDLHVQQFDRYDRSLMTFNPHRMEDWAEVTAD